MTNRVVKLHEVNPQVQDSWWQPVWSVFLDLFDLCLDLFEGFTLGRSPHPRPLAALKLMQELENLCDFWGELAKHKLLLFCY